MALGENIKFKKILNNNYINYLCKIYIYISYLSFLSYRFTFLLESEKYNGTILTKR